MVKLLVLILGLVSFQVSATGISIVSDLDDTLKITNVSDLSEAVRNALFSKKAFKGMPDLIQEMSHYSNSTYILTASPKVLNSRVTKFLDFNKISYQDLYMRSLLGQSDKKAYKLAVVREVLTLSDDNLVLIGDDVEIDHEVYTQIRAENPNRVAAIYIHKVKNKKLPVKVNGFFTAYDIARMEYQAGRMSLLQALTIGKNILLTRDFFEVIPDFSYCPKSDEDFESTRLSALSLLTNQINGRIQKFCSK
ncbi:MAG: hypothetical protein ACJAS4_002285 [Bacteriovoracaceae bacterium]|jgi:hypothetical protein